MVYPTISLAVLFVSPALVPDAYLLPQFFANVPCNSWMGYLEYELSPSRACPFAAFSYSRSAVVALPESSPTSARRGEGQYEDVRHQLSAPSFGVGGLRAQTWGRWWRVGRRNGYSVHIEVLVRSFQVGVEAGTESGRTDWGRGGRRAFLTSGVRPHGIASMWGAWRHSQEGANSVTKA